MCLGGGGGVVVALETDPPSPSQRKAPSQAEGQRSCDLGGRSIQDSSAEGGPAIELPGLEAGPQEALLLPPRSSSLLQQAAFPVVPIPFPLPLSLFSGLQ